MSTDKINKLVKQTFNKVQKLNTESDEDLHKLFIKEYKKLVSKETIEKGDCSFGKYCGEGGCYRHRACTFKDGYPKSKEIAIKLGVYEKNKYE